MNCNFSCLTMLIFVSLILGGCDADSRCPETEPFCHENGDLRWSDISEEPLSWSGAVSYCNNIGGRVPKISELRTLVRRCSVMETGGECGVTDDCWESACKVSCPGCEPSGSGKYSVFKDTEALWSSTQYDGYTYIVWYVLFSSASINHAEKSSQGFVRCLK